MTSPVQPRPRFIRILLVENDDSRYAYFKAAAPPHFRLVHAKTGGAALSILARDEPDTYAGVMLDHDLDRAGYGPSTDSTNGLKVAAKVVAKVDVNQPIPGPLDESARRGEDGRTAEWEWVLRHENPVRGNDPREVQDLAGGSGRSGCGVAPD